MYAQAGNHDSIEDSRAALALYRKYEQVRIDGQMNKRGRDCYSALVPAPTVHSVVCSTARLDNTVSYYAVCVCVCVCVCCFGRHGVACTAHCTAYCIVLYVA